MVLGEWYDDENSNSSNDFGDLIKDDGESSDFLNEIKTDEMSIT